LDGERGGKMLRDGEKKYKLQGEANSQGVKKPGKKKPSEGLNRTEIKGKKGTRGP